MNISHLTFFLLLFTGLVALNLTMTPATYGQDGPVVVYGDSRAGHDIHRDIVSAIIAEHPAVVFHTGDYVTDSDREDQWDDFFEITAPLRDATLFYPARGNHDGDRVPFVSRFSIPGGTSWYAVNLLNMRFLVLDSNTSLSPNSFQYQWLRDELSTTDERYLCVVLHHPIYNSTAGGHEEDEKGLIPYIESLFVTAGVDLVFAGHVHAYERLEKNGVTYLISGGGGAGLYTQVERSDYSQVYEMKHHYVRLSPEHDGLLVEAITIDGSIIDCFIVDGN